MPQLTLYADLDTRQLVSSDGSQITLPAFVLGDTLSCQLSLLKRDATGTLQTVNLNVRTVQASIGFIAAPPTGGTFTLSLQDPLSLVQSQGLSIAYNATSDQVANALSTAAATLGWTVSAATGDTGCWVVTISGAAHSPVNILVADNSLTPVTFVRVREFQQDNVWRHEIRLLQAPLSFNSGFSAVLPPPPSVSRIFAGAPPTGTQPGTNELQDLFLPPNFNGTYFLQWNGYTTSVLGTQNGASDIANALNSLFTDGKTRFDVTNPSPNHAYIQFMGPLETAPQPLITVTVQSFSPGVITFDLPLWLEEMETALRGVSSIQPVLQVTLQIVDDDQDVSDNTVPGYYVTLCQQVITIQRTEIYPELQVVQNIDWLTPPSPTNYVPFTRNQVITGQQFYVAGVGDGLSQNWVLQHNLGTINALVGVYDNTTGRILALNAEYCAQSPNPEAPDPNAIELFFAAVPTAGQYTAIVCTAGPSAAFMAGLTITPAQVVGLLSLINSLQSQVNTLNSYIASGNALGAPASTATNSVQYTIPNIYVVLPSDRLPAGFTAPASLNVPPVGLPATPPPLPTAWHTIGGVVALPSPIPSAASPALYQNTSGAPIVIPSAPGRRSFTVPSNGYLATDGRGWYPANSYPGISSFYPSAFDQVLIPPIDLDGSIWRAGQTFSLQFDLTLALINANSSAQWVLVVESGTCPEDQFGTPGPNLQNVVWRTTPLLTQRIVISSLAQTRHFGVALGLNANGTITAQKLLQSTWYAADDTPVSSTIAVRVRLIQFDTEDNFYGTATGWAYAALTNAVALIQ